MRPKTLFSWQASMELARATQRLLQERSFPIVGFDLAGEEAGYPAVHHQETFQFVHDHFIRKTIHAGEAYGPESIFQAITQCYANRIGHGTFLFAQDRIKDEKIKDKEGFVEGLVEYIASQRIHIEVNLTSNLQTIPSLTSISHHSLRQMIDRNLSASICTDNRLVSNTSNHTRDPISS